MGKKKYTTEIIDAFGGEMKSKEALKIAKKIKAAQELAVPSKKYKQGLFSRLENMHLIDQLEDVPPRFSIFQIFGTFASFIFIFGTTFMVYDFRESSKNMYHIPQSMPFPLQQQEHIIEDEGNVDYGDNIESENTVINNIKQEKKQEKEVGSFQEYGVEMEKTRVLESIPETITTDLDTGEENIQSRMMDAPEDTNMMMTESMMAEDVGELDGQKMSFGDICSEYDGMLSEDEIYCILPGGKLCEEQDIYDCANADMKIEENDDIEINLEELMEAYGQ